MKPSVKIINAVISMVCRERGVSVNRLKSRNRDDLTAISRHIVYYVLRKFTSMTLNEIAGVFKNDHNVVIHAQKNIASLAETDRSFNNKLVTIVAKSTRILGVDNRSIPKLKVVILVDGAGAAVLKCPIGVEVEIQRKN